jgi:hypothetical protein
MTFFYPAAFTPFGVRLTSAFHTNSDSLVLVLLTIAFAHVPCAPKSNSLHYFHIIDKYHYVITESSNTIVTAVIAELQFMGAMSRCTGCPKKCGTISFDHSFFCSCSIKIILGSFESPTL